MPQKMKNEDTNEGPVLPQLLTLTEMCKQLHVGRTTLWKMRNHPKHPLPTHPIGSEIRIDTREAAEWWKIFSEYLANGGTLDGLEQPKEEEEEEE